jgi:hypothetical protein
MKTKINQPRNNRLKELPKIAYQAVSEEVRRSYPDLHVITLLIEINPFFLGINLQGY